MLWPRLKLALYFSLLLPLSLPPPSILPFPLPTEPPGVSLQPLHSCSAPLPILPRLYIHLSVLSFMAYSRASLPVSPILHPPPLQWLLPLWVLPSLCLGLLCENGVIVVMLRRVREWVCTCVWYSGGWVLCLSASVSCCPASIRTQANKLNCTSTALADIPNIKSVGIFLCASLLLSRNGMNIFSTLFLLNPGFLFINKKS